MKNSYVKHRHRPVYSQRDGIRLLMGLLGGDVFVRELFPVTAGKWGGGRPQGRGARWHLWALRPGGDTGAPQAASLLFLVFGRRLPRGAAEGCRSCWRQRWETRPCRGPSVLPSSNSAPWASFLQITLLILKRGLRVCQGRYVTGKLG